MSQEDNELIKNRIEKLKNLISMDIDPYPSNYKRTHTSKEAIDYFFKLFDIETIPPKNMVRAPIHIQITSGL